VRFSEFALALYRVFIFGLLLGLVYPRSNCPPWLFIGGLVSIIIAMKEKK
jgi:hypothetical protein